MIASRVLRLQPTRAAFLQPSRRMMATESKESLGAKIKKVPAELWPIGAVLGVALGFAGYSLGNKLLSDQTLRLKRTGSSH